MDESRLWRRLLVNNLVDAAIRFELLAPMGEFVGPIFKALSRTRLQWAARILRDNPDEELQVLLGDPGSNASILDVLAQEVKVAREQGPAFAAEFTIDGELAIADFVKEMSDEDLPGALRDLLLQDLQAGVARLTLAVSRTRAQGPSIHFSVKSAGSVDPPPESPQRVYELWFGTNRATVEENGVVIGFSAETSAMTTLGRCGVTIPDTHRIGEAKPPWWRRVVFGERPLALESVIEFAPDAFWADLRAKLVPTDVRADDAIVFLHGYNVSFEDAAICAAQIGADLNLPGATAFFSWPSSGRLRAYPADEASIEASELHITEFLEAFVQRSGAGRVHLIAHSMGNRGLLRAINRIAAKVAEGSRKPFGQIILAAPDVDRRTFAMLCQAYPTVGLRTTLYVSSKDLAVRSSRVVHSAARIGFEPPVTIQPGIDTVSVSKVDLSLLGHGYVAGCRTVLTDIHQLIVSELDPDRRAGMTPMKAADGRYWELAP